MRYLRTRRTSPQKKRLLRIFEKEHETLLKQRESLFDFLEQGIYTKENFYRAVKRSRTTCKRMYGAHYLRAERPSRHARTAGKP